MLLFRCNVTEIAGNSNKSPSVTVMLTDFHILKVFWPIYHKLEILIIAWRYPFCLFIFCINTRVQEKQVRKKGMEEYFFTLFLPYASKFFSKICVLRCDLVYPYGWETVTFIRKQKVTTFIFLPHFNENVSAVLFDNFIVTWLNMVQK